jgi:UDP-N-acetylglucosamine 2-epimerase (non-hydrolysing)
MLRTGPETRQNVTERLLKSRIVSFVLPFNAYDAPAFGVPTLVMREARMRPEGVEAGVTKLVGTRRERITGEAARLLTDAAAHRAMTKGVNPYGDGQAASRIVAKLLKNS